MTNTNKLKGKIVENGYNMTTFAKALCLSSFTVRRKLKGEVAFTATEIMQIRNLLNLSYEDVEACFFA